MDHKDKLNFEDMNNCYNLCFNYTKHTEISKKIISCGFVPKEKVFERCMNLCMNNIQIEKDESKKITFSDIFK